LCGTLALSGVLRLALDLIECAAKGIDDGRKAIPLGLRHTRNEY